MPLRLDEIGYLSKEAYFFPGRCHDNGIVLTDTLYIEKRDLRLVWDRVTAV